MGFPLIETKVPLQARLSECLLLRDKLLPYMILLDLRLRSTTAHGNIQTIFIVDQLIKQNLGSLLNPCLSEGCSVL